MTSDTLARVNCPDEIHSFDTPEEAAAFKQGWDGRAAVKSEPLTYAEENTRVSFFADLVRSAKGIRESQDRLERHRVEMDVELRTAPNTTSGTGGEFAPPLWVIERFTTQARAGRVLTDLVTKLVLPPGVSSVHAPKETTSGDVSVQGGQGGAVQDVDSVTADAGANGNVVTIAGEIDASLQLLDLTPAPGYDGIAYIELNRAYNALLEQQSLAGTGSNGQITGVQNVVGRNNDVSGSSITTVDALWPALGQIAAAVGNTRKLPIEFYLMAPRRWSWLASSVDSSKRPIASPGQPAHMSDYPFAPGNASPAAIALGAGQPMWGPGFPIYLDGAIPSGSSADVAIALRASDMLLFESDPKFAVTFNATASTLQARLQLRRYVAFVNTKPSSICVLTGLPQPSNF